MLTLFLRSAQHRRVAVTSTVAAAALFLSACASVTEPSTAVDAGGVQSPIEASVDLTSGPITGVGPRMEAPIDLVIPERAESLSVEFRYAGSDGFLVEYGDPMIDGLGSFSGECGVDTAFTWPIRTGIRPALFVLVGADAEWTITPTFSEAPFVSDPAVEADCAAYVEVISAFHNADSGYSFYEVLTVEEWAERIIAAEEALDTLIDDAQSALVDSFLGIQDGITGPGVETGRALSSAADDVRDVQRACDRNHTPIYIQAEFGG